MSHLSFQSALFSAFDVTLVVEIRLWRSCGRKSARQIIFDGAAWDASVADGTLSVKAAYVLCGSSTRVDSGVGEIIK